VHVPQAGHHTQNINGTEFEVFLKNSKTKELIPHTYAEFGTGFFIGKDLDYYLVTAEHVAKHTNSNTLVTLKIEGTLPFKVLLKDLVDQKQIINNEVKWIYHKSADVAVVSIAGDKVKKWGITSFPYYYLNKRLEDPRRSSILTVFGYPFGLGENKMNSPVSKKFSPASGIIELPRFDNKVISNFFLIDDPNIGGYSGGPVIKIPELVSGLSLTFVDDYSLLGLVHGNIKDGEGYGYGAIVPSKFIVETIEQIPGYNGKHVYKYPDGKNWSEVYYKNGEAWTVLSNNDKNGTPQERGTLLEGNGTSVKLIIK
jgi:S1-C subfamily serine protease